MTSSVVMPHMAVVFAHLCSLVGGDIIIIGVPTLIKIGVLTKMTMNSRIIL